MVLFKPPRSRIRQIQRTEQAYYFSAAFSVVLRKHGILPARTHSAGRFIHELGFICRGTAWATISQDIPVIFEGPVVEAALQRLGIEAKSHRTQSLDLWAINGDFLSTLRMNRAMLRPPRTTASKSEDPYLFVSDDPFWNQDWFNYQSFAPRHGFVPALIATTEHGRERVVGLRSQNRLFLGVPLFDIAVQHHVTPPYPNAFAGMFSTSDTLPVEKWLLDVAEELIVAAGRSLVRLAPWPAGFRAAMTVRHDYDRPIPDTALTALLEFYRQREIRSTWFWRMLHADRGQVESVRRDRHEVALHSSAATAMEFGAGELRAFQEQFGYPPAGFSVHGGAGAAGYLGMHQNQWAMRLGLRYGEILDSQTTLPFQAVFLDDGIPDEGNLVLHAQHRSLDRGTHPDAHCYEDLLPKATKALNDGNHCIVMNHPDIHVDVLIRLLDELNLRLAWRATLEDVARWYRVTHVSATCIHRRSETIVSIPESIPWQLDFSVRDSRGRRCGSVLSGDRIGRVLSRQSIQCVG